MKKTSSFNTPTTMMTFQRGEQTSNFKFREKKNEKTQNREKVKHAKQKLGKAKKRLSGNGPKMGLQFGCACTPNVNQDLIINSRFNYT